MAATLAAKTAAANRADPVGAAVTSGTPRRSDTTKAY
jgi:hypothetical protein